MSSAMQFRITNDKVVCVTPESGIDIPDFLQTMRRALDTYRYVQGNLSPSCTLNVKRTENVNDVEECTT